MKSKLISMVSVFGIVGIVAAVAQPAFAKGFKAPYEGEKSDDTSHHQLMQIPKQNEGGTKFQNPSEQKGFYQAPQKDFFKDQNQNWQNPPQQAPKYEIQNPSIKYGGKGKHNLGGDNNDGSKWGPEQPKPVNPSPPPQDLRGDDNAWKSGGNNWGNSQPKPQFPPNQPYQPSQPEFKEKEKNWNGGNKNWGSYQGKPNNPPQNNPEFKFKDNDKHWNGGNSNNNYYGGNYGGGNKYGNNQKHFYQPSPSQPFTNFHFKKDKGHDYWGPHGQWNNWNYSWGDPYYYARRWGFDEWNPNKGWRRGNYWYSHPSQWSDWGGWFSFYLTSGGLLGFSYDSGYDPYYSNYGNECLRLYDQDWYYGRRAVYSFIACRDFWGRFNEIRGTRRFEDYVYY